MRTYRNISLVALACVLLTTLTAGCSLADQASRLPAPGAAQTAQPAVASPEQRDTLPSAKTEALPDQGAAEDIITLGGEPVTKSSPDDVQQAPGGDADEGVVSGDPGSAEGSEPSSGAGGDAATPDEQGPVDWQTYCDGQFGFCIQYPEVYVIMPPARQDDQLAPRPLAEVLFQDRQLAAGDTAELEPAQFAVRVFDNAAELPIKEWLDTTILVGGEEGWTLTPYRSGLHVCTRLMLAPNCFFYLPQKNYVVQLTPLGEYSDAMLASFEFTK